MTARFDQRRLATYFAVLALLIQQGLLPVLHYALGAGLAGGAQLVSAGPHLHHHGSGESDDPGDANHGPCHFCRVLGAALPLPPVAELARLEPATIAFPPPVAATRPDSWSSRAHPARGPPPPPILA